MSKLTHYVAMVPLFLKEKQNCTYTR